MDVFLVTYHLYCEPRERFVLVYAYRRVWVCECVCVCVYVLAMFFRKLFTNGYFTRIWDSLHKMSAPSLFPPFPPA